MNRNYRELSEEELQEIAALYPVTPNREISRRYNISVDAITDFLARPNGWEKDKKSVFLCNRNGRSLTEREVRWIIRHFQHTRNQDIMEKFGIGESSLHRIARKHGLRKSRQFMKKKQREAVEIAHQACVRYGIYEESAERMRQLAIERSERGERIPGAFMPGVNNEMRLGKKRNRERIEKARQTRNKSIELDRKRMRFGLPQRTNMRLHYYGYTEAHRKASVHRHLFRRAGYIVDYGSDTVYYDEDTVRRPKMEANAHKYGLKVRMINDNG